MNTPLDTTSDKQSETSGGHASLTYYIVAAISLAIAIALILPALLPAETALSIFHTVSIGGEVFLRALMMMVVPLVVASVMSGILGLGDVRKLGRPGFTAVFYYLSTTVLAVVVGLIWVNIIQPGKNGTKAPSVVNSTTDAGNTDRLPTRAATSPDHEEVFVTAADRGGLLHSLEEHTGLASEKLVKVFPQLADGLPGNEPGIGMIMGNLVLMLFTDNLLGAAVETNLLPLIIFAIIFAGMLTTMGERVKSITTMIGQANEAMMSFVLLLMKIAPLGIFCLVTSKFGIAHTEGKFVEVILRTSGFIVTVLAGLGTHFFVTLPLIYYFVTRKNPFTYMKHMSRALLTAFSTASSSATLPVTMDSANKAGVSKRSTDFVLPLGATINMDGTALYEAAAAIFIANITPGFELTFLS